MELHQLRYFVAVAKLGNFSRAAEQCHVSQPSLSQQILKLERRLGQRLLDRLGKRAVLTEAGRILFDRAVAILTAVDDAEREVRDFDQDKGRLVVGAIPTIAPYLLPDAVRKFANRFPAVDLVLQEDLTGHLLAAAVAGDLDMAILALPVADDRLHVEVLFTEPLLLALPKGHRLSTKKRITLADVREERFIVLDEMHCLGEQILHLCRAEGCQRLVCRSAQLSTVLSLVALGQGISLVPRMAQPAGKSAQPVVFRELSEKSPTRTVVAVWHKDRYHGKTGERFLELLRSPILAR
ncbi:MAG: hydrogen peroxide-inducible genes activator [Gemmatales bacterium]|nr:hydrogen peroxide-inducible genes activator [Gemmatales bacterium]MDW8388244.1 hydrogen peroxide-inducible genes activator [Gemmatales bacterium]